MKVSEGLPPVGDDVLIYNKFMGWVTGCLINAREGPSGTWIEDVRGEVVTVSHWLPLPPKPED